MAALALLALACAALWFALGGIIDGNVAFPTAKREIFEIYRDASPKNVLSMRGDLGRGSVWLRVARPPGNRLASSASGQ